MGRLKMRLYAISATACFLISGAGSLSYKNKADVNNYDNTVPGYVQGYEDFPLINTKVKANNFVLFDIGDNDSVKTARQEQKMGYCVKNNIPFGLVVTSDAKSQDKIYRDVDYVKSILSKYRASFPIYLNVDSIVESDDLMPEVKIKLIKDFLVTCSSNGMFVGISGKDSNLCRLKSYSSNILDFNIEDYSIYLLMESDTIKYDGNYVIYKTVNGDIYNNNTDSVYWSIIRDDLNKDSSLLNNATYVVQEGEDIQDVAMRFGFSVNEILRYNTLRKSDIKVGTELVIPSKFEKQLPIDSKNVVSEKLDEPKIGIDISEHNANIDWDFVKNNFKFVIMKCSEGTYIDPNFENNYKNCVERGIPVGVYVFNARWHKSNLEEYKNSLINQTENMLKCINNKNITFPVYLDLEPNINVENLTPDELRALLSDFATSVKNAGFTPGIYYSGGVYKDITNRLNLPEDKELLSQFENWYAGGSEIEKTNDFRNYIPVSNNEYYGAEYGVHQISWRATGTNASTAKGWCDLDFCYVDYDNDVYYEEISGKQPDYNFSRDFIQKLYDGISYAGYACLAIVVAGSCCGATYLLANTMNNALTNLGITCDNKPKKLVRKK